MRLWLAIVFWAGCAGVSSRPGPGPAGWASREDGVDIRVELATLAPSFAVTVENRAGEPISFDGAQITVEDEAGHSFRAVADPVRVAPGSTFSGGLALSAPKTLERGRIGVVMRGVHLGARELEPQAFVFDWGEPVAQACDSAKER